MRLPRDVSGVDLVKALRVFGYLESRTTGSHIRVTTEEGGQHHVTIPKHDPLKLGTLKSILDDVANHQGVDRNELLAKLLL